MSSSNGIRRDILALSVNNCCNTLLTASVKPRSVVFPRRALKVSHHTLVSWMLPVVDTLLVTNGRADEQSSVTAASYT